MFINNRQSIRIERREWYNVLQHDISPLFKPNFVDSHMALELTRLDNSPQAVRFFAANSHALTDYGYWFFLGVCWVQYTGWSDLELWKKLFASDRPHRAACLMKPTELRHFRALPNVVHCYRVHRPGEQDWLSYTLDLDTARRFTTTRGVTEVHEYRIPRSRLLCLFLRRHEYEVLCLDTRHAEPHGVVELEELSA